jgi:phospho-N-acetylmuramoyl-pentapeptide-transferase
MTTPTLYFCLSFLSAIVLAKPIIRFLKALKSEQKFRELGPKSHLENKAGTPTMGAWIFLIPIFTLSALFYLQDSDKDLILIMLAVSVGAVMGALDDILKILKSNYRGLNSIQKLLIQFISSSVIAYASTRACGIAWTAAIPEYIWAFLVIAGTSNAINLTDGLDGLASSLCIIAFLALGLVLLLIGERHSYTLTAIIIGALFGFLFFNKKPAQVFMGDTGSLALGMGLGTLAYVHYLEWYLLIFALVPVCETLSVVLQVLSAQISRRFFGRDWRIFKMAPLHHHFELSGLSENQVVLYFCLFQILVIGIFILEFL